MADLFIKDQLSGFVPTEVSANIISDVVRGSSVLRLCKMEPMTTPTRKIPVFTNGVGAYWVGETERIQASAATWIYPELVAKKLGVIIPVSKEKLNDTTINVFSELQGPISEAFYTLFDAAALFGTNTPFTNSIYNAASNVGNIIEVGTNSSYDLDIADTMSFPEDYGQDINGFAAHYGVKNTLRKLRDTNGNQLFVAGVDTSTLYEQPIEFSRNGAWDKGKAEIIAGNWNMALAGIMAEIEYEILKEATLHSITMPDGKPLSLAENDMVAIKATMRIAFLPVKEEAFSVLTRVVTAPTATLVSTGTITVPAPVVAKSDEKGYLYLAPSATSVSKKSDLDTVVTAGTAKKVAVTKINTNTNIVTTGLSAGAYKVYAVDDAGNVSAATSAITLATE